VVMSNTELLKNTINNYKRLAERRIVFKFGINHGATPEQAEEVPKIVRRIVEENGKGQARFDRAHFQGFGASSLDYEAVYIVLSSDYNLYMDLQQSINLQLMRELARLGVEFAHPTRTVVLARAEGQGAPGGQAAPQLV
jgi:small-conductance mechanosensitive channel